MPPRPALAGLLVPVCILLAGAPPLAHADPREVTAPADLQRAADAALAEGDIATYRATLQALDAEKPSDKTKAELARIAAGYGQVTLVSDGSTLRYLGLAQSAEAALALAWANQQAAATGRFEGLLAVGDYHVGETPFTVAPGDLVRVVAYPRIRIANEAPTCGPCCHGYDCGRERLIERDWLDPLPVPRNKDGPHD